MDDRQRRAKPARKPWRGADLLQTRGHDPKTVVVERNGNIVPADAFAATQLHGGDVLEIVQFVGGG